MQRGAITISSNSHAEHYGVMMTGKGVYIGGLMGRSKAKLDFHRQVSLCVPQAGCQAERLEQEEEEFVRNSGARDDR